jgi:ATP-binding cassette subfamily B protein
MAHAAFAALAIQWRCAPVLCLLTAALGAGTGLVSIGGAWFLKELLDELSRGTNPSAHRAVVLAISTAAITGGGTTVFYLVGHLNQLIEWRITLEVQRTLFEKINTIVGLKTFEDAAFQNQLQLATQAAQQAPQQISQLALSLVRSTVAIGSSSLAVALIAPSMVWILLLVAGVALLAQAQQSRREVGVVETLVQTYRWLDYYRGLLVDVRAAKEIRLFGLGKLFLERLVNGLNHAARRNVAVDRSATALHAAIALLTSLVIAWGTVVVTRGVLAGRFHLGDVSLFLGAAVAVQVGTTGLIMELGGGARALLLFENYLAVLALPQPVVPGAQAAQPLRKGLELRDAWFRYSAEQPWVLRGVNLRIAAGQTLGLVGANGAGKSTLVKLLCRLWDLEQGQILWDGVDIRELEPVSLRRRIACTFQDFVTYEATAAENIAFGDERHLADLKRIRAAAALTEIDEKLSHLPDGYQTLLSRTLTLDEQRGGPGGVTLSGGEWQRVALARSLFRSDADLYILDEPASGLDVEAEFRLHQTLQHHGQGGTRLLISHRLGALRSANQIAVLSDGVIIEQGSHDELMRAKGRYAELFTLQAQSYQDDHLREKDLPTREMAS